MSLLILGFLLASWSITFVDTISSSMTDEDVNDQFWHLLFVLLLCKWLTLLPQVSHFLAWPSSSCTLPQWCVLFATMPAFIGEPWSCAVLVLSYYDLFHFWSARVPALRKLMFVHSNKHTALNTTCFVTRSHLQICSKNFTFQFLSYVEAPLAFLCVMVSWFVVCNFRFSTNFSSSFTKGKFLHPALSQSSLKKANP